jgi:hypothetical protein
LLSPFLAGVVQGQERLEKSASVAEANSSRYDLEIVDGRLRNDGKLADATLGNAVEVLRERYPDANIVLSPGLGALKISDLKLRAGRLADVLEALRIASGEKFIVQGHAGPPDINPATGLPANPKKPEADLFILRGESSPSETVRTVEAFNIDPYLKWFESKPHDNREEDASKSLEELKRMIWDAIANLKGNDASQSDMPSFSFHAGANVLVVTGTRQAVDVAQKIIRALPGEEILQAGVAASTAETRAALEDAFRARYGLPPRPALPTREPRLPNDEALRKRYGIPPSGTPAAPTTPERSPPPNTEPPQ